MPNGTKAAIPKQLDKLLSPAEAAVRFGVKPDTVRKWIREGAIPVVRSGPHKLPRIKSSVVEMFLTT